MNKSWNQYLHKDACAICHAPGFDRAAVTVGDSDISMDLCEIHLNELDADLETFTRKHATDLDRVYVDTHEAGA